MRNTIYQSLHMGLDGNSNRSSKRTDVLHKNLVSQIKTLIPNFDELYEIKYESKISDNIQKASSQILNRDPLLSNENAVNKMKKHSSFNTYGSNYKTKNKIILGGQTKLDSMIVEENKEEDDEDELENAKQANRQ